MTEPNQGGDLNIDPLGSGARGRSRLRFDSQALNPLKSMLDGIIAKYDKVTTAANRARDAMNGANGQGGQSGGQAGTVAGSMAGSRGAIPAQVRTAWQNAGGTQSVVNAVFGQRNTGQASTVTNSMSGSLGAIPTSQALGGVGASAGGGAGGASGLLGAAGGGGGGGRGGAPGSLGSTLGHLKDVVNTSVQPFKDLNHYLNQRIGIGAEYSLQADRMTSMYQQMYGMSNGGVRSGFRMPLTSHWLLGGGTAINDMLALQAGTGLNAKQQASSVEAIRAVSGFSYGSKDVTGMLAGMASPEVANRMFMMGGTGMYGIGGKQRSGMAVIQDIVKRAGLTNQETLKGALQQGSNTRQRLTALGVPQDMQDMVIQYAMENQQYSRRTGGGEMYDPSKEEHRQTMGIENNYITQHEKTTGKRIEREERFYGRQTDNFAHFEKNLRSTTAILMKFEEALQSIIGLKIGLKGNPYLNAAGYMGKQGAAIGSAFANLGVDAATLYATGGASALAPGAGPGGGDATVSVGNASERAQSSATRARSKVSDPPEPPVPSQISRENEAKLASLDPDFASKIRQMLEENPNLKIGDAKRSSGVQERSFRARYTAHPELKEKTQTADRWWNGVLWVHDNHGAPKDAPAMAAPGNSWHEKGLAADIRGDDQWLIKNASRFGLVHGGTGTGKADDEPFHIQPSYTKGKTAGNDSANGPKTESSVPSASSSSSGSVSAASSMAQLNATTPIGKTAPAASFKNAGYMAAQSSRVGMTGESGSIIGNTERPYTPSSSAASVSTGGDSTSDRYPVRTPQPVMSGATQTAPSITVAPNIYLNGSQDLSNDLKRIAREVGALLEQEVKLKLMRSV